MKIFLFTENWTKNIKIFDTKHLFILRVTKLKLKLSTVTQYGSILMKAIVKIFDRSKT